MKLVAGGALGLWLSTLLPAVGASRWGLVAGMAAVLVVLLVLRPMLIRWHSELEVGLEDTLTEGDRREAALQAPTLGEDESWNLKLVDCVLPDLAGCSGRTLQELELPHRFGCTVVGIDRQGHVLPLPSGSTRLYPQDRLLLLGSPAALEGGKAYLQSAGEEEKGRGFEDVRLEILRVPDGSAADGLPLSRSPSVSGRLVRIVGVERGGLRLSAPSADDVLRGGDRVLAVGSPEALAELRAWLEGLPSYSGDGL
jgi:CPA2 family monovalent cation:H+ antiporter-2